MSFTDGENYPDSLPPDPAENCIGAGWPLVAYSGFWLLVWWISYGFLKLTTNRSAEWCCRLLTFVHGVVVSYAALYDIIIYKRGVDFEEELSTDQKNYFAFMLSYFSFDLIWMFMFGNETWVIYFHHFSSILVIFKMIWSNTGGGGISYGVAGLEFTNPYLQTRWFLRTHGYYQTPIHVFVELWFFFLFLTIRVIGGSVLFYIIETSDHVDVTMKIFLVPIFLVSMVLSWQVFVYFTRKYLFDVTRISTGALLLFRRSVENEEREQTLPVDENSEVTMQTKQSLLRSSIPLSKPLLRKQEDDKQVKEEKEADEEKEANEGKKVKEAKDANEAKKTKRRESVKKSK